MIKNLLRKVWRTKTTVFVRNMLGIRPIYRRWLLLNQSYAASDQFLWRTDHDFQTEFRVSDIVGKYYGQKSFLRIHVFDKQGRKINQFEQPVEAAVERIFINENNAAADSYGTFSVFHIPETDAGTNYAITNRCYTGYSRLGSMPSFVHGNLLSKIQLLEVDNSPEPFSGFIRHRKKTEFYIQKDLEYFDRIELMFVNPLENPIDVTLGEATIKLNPGEVRLIELDRIACRPVKIQSDFFFPRPVIFSFRQQYFDVHHA